MGDAQRATGDGMGGSQLEGRAPARAWVCDSRPAPTTSHDCPAPHPPAGRQGLTEVGCTGPPLPAGDVRNGVRGREAPIADSRPPLMKVGSPRQLTIKLVLVVGREEEERGENTSLLGSHWPLKGVPEE
eukprot:scaffold235394_cov31-Tisochrysis_lutea.AAC.1